MFGLLNVCFEFGSEVCGCEFEFVGVFDVNLLLLLLLLNMFWRLVVDVLGVVCFFVWGVLLVILIFGCEEGVIVVLGEIV